MSETILKPCPFCGHTATLILHPDGTATVACDHPVTDRGSCIANPGAFGDTASQAAEAWNTRAPTQPPSPPPGGGEESPASPLADEVTRLRAELTRLRTALAAAERAGAERAQAIPADQWREDYGPCLWWKDYLGEAPVVGSPLDSDWAEVNDPDEPFTHFTRIPNPVFPPPGAEVGRG